MNNNDIKNLIFAHRGCYNNKDIPENSLSAFKIALKNNVNIELDIKLLKDNSLVVFHDYNLKRMTGIDKLINDCTYNDICNLKLLNTNEYIPLLTEVLDLVDNKVIINIEIKEYSLFNKIEKRLLSIIKHKNYKILISSFNPLSLIYLKKRCSNYLYGYLIFNYKNIKFIINKILEKLLSLKYFNIDFIIVNKKGINSLNINKYKKKNILIFAFNITSKYEINKYKNIVDSYIVNYYLYEYSPSNNFII